jgi:hypothetical protein
MLSGGMTNGSIGISALPSQDGSTIDDEVACANQPTANGRQHTQHEKRLWQRRSGEAGTLALLRGAGNTWVAMTIQRQAASQG